MKPYAGTTGQFRADAQMHRIAEHPSGEFTDSFETDASWAGDLQPGSAMFVLVDPTERRVLFDLGQSNGLTDQ